MKQKKFPILIIVAIFGLMLFSCVKEDIYVDITLNKWKVEKIKKQGEMVFIKTNESYILEFINDTIYTINLDVNHCGGKYKIITSGTMEIEDTYCTEICCDSDFAEDLVQLLSKTAKYFGKGNELIFEGDGEIVFIKD